MYPEVGGAILKTYVRKDDHINAGDVILEIDAADFEYEIKMREATIKGYESQIKGVTEEEANRKAEYMVSIDKLNAELLSIEGQRKAATGNRASAPSSSEQVKLLELAITQAETERKFAVEERDKIKILVDNGVATKSDLDAAEQKVSLIESNISSLNEQLSVRRDEVAREAGGTSLASQGDNEYFDALAEAIRTQIDSFAANLEKDYSQNSIDYYQVLIDTERVSIDRVEKLIEKCTVMSPVSGVVSDIPAVSQSMASPAVNIATIKVRNSSYITTALTTRDINDVNVGDKVEIIRKLRSEDKSYTGAVLAISDWADVKMSALGIEERRVNVKVSADQEIPDLSEGYDVDIRFTVFKEDNCLMAPLTAVFKRDGKNCVFTVVDDTAVITEVVTGARTSDRIIVTSGLTAGDVVISDPNVEGLKEGVKVASN